MESSRVVPVTSEQVEISQPPAAAGVKRYQTLRVPFGWQVGAGASPEDPAPVTSAVTVDSAGNGPAPGIVSAPAQVSLAGGGGGGGACATRSCTADFPFGGAAVPYSYTMTKYTRPASSLRSVTTDCRLFRGQPSSSHPPASGERAPAHVPSADA